MQEQETNYFFCHKCRLYTPAWHPRASTWWLTHSICTTTQPHRHVHTDGLKQTDVVVLGEAPLPSEVSFGPNPPEGYGCDPEIGPLEELAYCAKPGCLRLT